MKSQVIYRRRVPQSSSVMIWFTKKQVKTLVEKETKTSKLFLTIEYSRKFSGLFAM